MVDIATFRQMALSLPGAVEHPHFNKAAFRIKKGIFATLDEGANLACLMLSAVDQDVFSAFDRSVIHPVPNKWGQKGATYVDLTKVRPDMLNDALTTAYQHIASKK